jgi:hypothetical protein
MAVSPQPPHEDGFAKSLTSCVVRPKIQPVTAFGLNDVNW